VGPNGTRDEPARTRTHLETPFVFIDTQAYVANAFDWHGLHFAKLVTLAHDGTLRLLITSVTRREIQQKIAEGLDEAIDRTRKYRTALYNAGINVEILRDRDTMLSNAHRQFEAFLQRANVVDIPLEASLDAVFDDYFAARPPFSKRKGKEFPDAFAGASLVAWLLKTRNSAYVVSGDGDFEAFCAGHTSLIYAKSISEIISRASVSAEIHAALVREIDSDLGLKDKLADALAGRSARTPSHWPRSARGRVDKAKVLGILSVNVIDSARPSFACELEFESELSISLNVLDESEPMAPHSYFRDVVVTRSFVAVAEIQFDPAQGEGLFVETVFVGGDEIEIDREDL
jgi:PIN domain